MSVEFHSDIRTRLRRAHVSGTIAQSYVLAGPRGVGKLTLALWYAKLLACMQGDATGPCDACSSCRAIQGGIHADVTVEAGDRTIPIGIEEIRILRERLTRTPLVSALSLCIIPDCERMSLAAQHALLKTLEEPRPHSVLIMTADAPEALLPTVLSRMAVIRLNYVPLSLLTRALHEADAAMDAAEVRELAMDARGIPGRILEGGRVCVRARIRAALVRSMEERNTKPLWRIQKELRASFDKDKASREIVEIISSMHPLPHARTPLIAPLLASLSRNINKDLALDTLGVILSRHG